MATYIVFAREDTQDQRELDIYLDQVGTTLASRPANALADDEHRETLEGEGAQGVVIVEFASKEAAWAWYDSPAYRQVVRHRFQGADYRAVMVQGA